MDFSGCDFQITDKVLSVHRPTTIKAKSLRNGDDI